MLDHSCQVQRHPIAERGVDLYETPAVATEALLRVEQIPQRIWEPAAGRGAIVRVLRDAGHTVIASDLIDYDFPLHTVGDFLKTTAMPAGCEAILTNPPFRWAEEFVAHALKLSPLVIMLLRLAFLESERRCGILEGRGLARIHVFRKRLPMMHRDQWAGKKANSGMAFAWYVFDRNHHEPPTIHRISWERPEPPPPQLGQRGRPKRGEGKGANGTLKRGSNSRSYIIARLNRDGHTKLAADVRAGRISARSAARAANNKRPGAAA